jgi:hypothetical protein
MASSDDDYPVNQMLEAAKKAKSNEEAVWAALSVLDKAGGWINLPTSNGGGWRPSIPHLKRRNKTRGYALRDGGSNGETTKAHNQVP